MIDFMIFFEFYTMTVFLWNDKTLIFFLKKTSKKSWYSNDIIDLESVIVLLSCFF
jgi:hypothetical protein